MLVSFNSIAFPGLLELGVKWLCFNGISLTEQGRWLALSERQGERNKAQCYKYSRFPLLCLYQVSLQGTFLCSTRFSINLFLCWTITASSERRWCVQAALQHVAPRIIIKGIGQSLWGMAEALLKGDMVAYSDGYGLGKDDDCGRGNWQHSSLKTDRPPPPDDAMSHTA